MPGNSKKKHARCQESTQVQLNHQLERSVIHRWESDIRGKNTCDTPEIAVAISLQVQKGFEELRVSKVAGMPYERNARANEPRMSEVKAMSEPVFGGEQPPMKKRRLLYSPEDSDMMTNATDF